MENLKDLFYQYYDESEEYFKLGEMPEVVAAYEEIKIQTKYFDKKEYDVLDDLIVAHGAANEMQGWIYGFQYAMKLMTACGVKGGVIA